MKFGRFGWSYLLEILIPIFLFPDLPDCCYHFIFELLHLWGGPLVVKVGLAASGIEEGRRSVDKMNIVSDAIVLVKLLPGILASEG